MPGHANLDRAGDVSNDICVKGAGNEAPLSEESQNLNQQRPSSKGYEGWMMVDDGKV